MSPWSPKLAESNVPTHPRTSEAAHTLLRASMHVWMRAGVRSLNTKCVHRSLAMQLVGRSAIGARAALGCLSLDKQTSKVHPNAHAPARVWVATNILGAVVGTAVEPVYLFRSTVGLCVCVCVPVCMCVCECVDPGPTCDIHKVIVALHSKCLLLFRSQKLSRWQGPAWVAFRLTSRAHSHPTRHVHPQRAATHAELCGVRASDPTAKIETRWQMRRHARTHARTLAAWPFVSTRTLQST